MAKKKVVAKEGQLPDPFEMMKAIDDKVEIASESIYSKIAEWIPTGSYLLNAGISGSLFGGIPSGRIITLAGPSGCGKSFVAASIVRESQKMNYTTLYLDSEAAIDDSFLRRIGANPEKVLIRSVSTVSEVSQIVNQTLDALQEQEDTYGKHNKFLIVIDSLSNLSSTKEMNDLTEGNNKKDLTRNQDIKAFFRTISAKAGRLGVSVLCTGHTYQSLDMFKPGNIVSGGTGLAYSASVTLELNPSKLIDKENDEAASKAKNSADIQRTGILVNISQKKSRFCRPIKIRIMIPLYKKINQYFGLESYLGWNINEKYGICRGSMLTDKEWEKLGGDSDTVHTWEFNGQTLHCMENDKARGIIVKHLGGSIDFKELFTEKVFDDEFLHTLDDLIIKPTFQLPNQDAWDDIEEVENLIDVGEEVKE